MKARWIVNLVLLLLIASIVTFLYVRPQPQGGDEGNHEISTLKLADFSRISIEFPSKAPVTLEKVDGYWRLTKPYNVRADQMVAQRILSIVAASGSEKFPATDLARFGLDTPKLTLRLDDQQFLFGTYNPVSGEQYVAYQDSVYLVPALYAENAAIQLVEMMDKNPLKPTEQVTGFDFSRLEQWEDTRLNVDKVNGKWQSTPANSKLSQEAMNEWMEANWARPAARSVEIYTPDRQASYPSFEVKLQDGSKVHFDKIQESPELLLARPDEGMLYHFAPDIGFTMLNPPAVEK